MIFRCRLIPRGNNYYQLSELQAFKIVRTNDTIDGNVQHLEKESAQLISVALF